MLLDYQTEFIAFAISQKVLQFGEFTLKSGRISPYFFNAGAFNDGASLHQLGRFYAAALQESGLGYDLLFGPAYKGIPLVASTVISLAADYGRNVPYVFNRKEAKAHGEGGHLVGAPLEGRVVIIDDVITAGTAIREVMDLLAASAASAVGVVVAIDRQERGKGNQSAIQEVAEDYGVTVVSVVNLGHIVEYLRNLGGHDSDILRIEAYREEFGV